MIKGRKGLAKDPPDLQSDWNIPCATIDHDLLQMTLLANMNTDRNKQ